MRKDFNYLHDVLSIKPLGTNLSVILNQNTKIFIQEHEFEKSSAEIGGHFVSVFRY